MDGYTSRSQAPANARTLPWGWSAMKVEDGMSALVLSIGPAHTLREAARMMAARRVGAAVVADPDHAGVGILTERDILMSIASGQSPDAEIAADHSTQDLVFAARDWTMEAAAAAMVRGGFRHLVVVEGQEVVGLLSMRDIVRCWSAARVPAQGAAAEGAQAAGRSRQALFSEAPYRVYREFRPGGIRLSASRE